ncbi:hypothetical protein ACFVAJ_16985 [Agromyces sp. NPDC057679]
MDEQRKRNHEREQVDAFLHSAAGFWTIVGVLAFIVIAGAWNDIARLFA